MTGRGCIAGRFGESRLVRESNQVNTFSSRRGVVVPLVSLTLLAGAVLLARPADAVPRAGSGERSATVTAAGCGLAETPGTRNQTIVVNGVSRRYLIVVPAAVTGSTPVPVVMGLHGGGDTAENANAYMGLNSTQPVLFVYPQAPYWPEAGGVGWNVDPTGVDFPYFDALLSDLKAKHCVDSARVFVTGKSNGGFMVNALGCHRPGMFRAIAPVAGGGPSTSNCPAGAAVAAMIIHGSADTTVSIQSGQWSLQYWLYRNNYQGAASVAAQPSPCQSYPGTQRPVLWCQHGGGHIWPTWAGAGIRSFFLAL